ncbi:hypothetical protein V8D89_009904 [Ganoderma adspersum]
MTHEPARPNEDIRQVLEILGCAVNLNSLHLSLDHLYSVIPPVSSPFLTFEALRHLTLCEPLTPWERSWIHHALRALRAPLATLRIETSNYQSHSSPSVLASLFDRNLSHFSTSSTLTSLHLARIPMYDDSFLGLPRFPSVRSLTIAKRLPREPKLDALLHLFPSLSGTLRLRRAEIKAANTRAQTAFRWTRLDRLDCESSTAQMLALQCPVRHLTIDAFDLFAVAAVQPRHVVIDSVHLPFYYDISQPLAETPMPIATTHVVLIMLCEAEEYEEAKINFYQPDSIRWETVLRHAAYSLSAFPHATHARLVVHCYNDRPSDDDLYDLMCHSRAVASAPTSLSTGDGSGPPSSVLAACPALRCFVMTAAGRDETESDPPFQRWMCTRAWRAVVAREGRGHTQEGGAEEQDDDKDPLRTFEELSDYKAERVIEDEDMGLSEEWEVRVPVIILGKRELTGNM